LLNNSHNCFGAIGCGLICIECFYWWCSRMTDMSLIWARNFWNKYSIRHTVLTILL
jgi:hypothetical protein